MNIGFTYGTRNEFEKQKLIQNPRDPEAHEVCPIVIACPSAVTLHADKRLA